MCVGVCVCVCVCVCEVCVEGGDSAVRGVCGSGLHREEVRVREEFSIHLQKRPFLEDERWEDNLCEVHTHSHLREHVHDQTLVLSHRVCVCVCVCVCMRERERSGLVIYGWVDGVLLV